MRERRRMILIGWVLAGLGALPAFGMRATDDSVYLDLAAEALEACTTPLPVAEALPTTGPHATVERLIYLRGNERDQAIARRLLLMPVYAEPEALAGTDPKTVAEIGRVLHASDRMQKLLIRCALENPKQTIDETRALEKEGVRFVSAAGVKLTDPTLPVLYGLAGKEADLLRLCESDSWAEEMSALCEATGRDWSPTFVKLFERDAAASTLTAKSVCQWLDARRLSGKLDVGLAEVMQTPDTVTQVEGLFLYARLLNEQGVATESRKVIAKALESWKRLTPDDLNSLTTSPLDLFDAGFEPEAKAALKVTRSNLADPSSLQVEVLAEHAVAAVVLDDAPLAAQLKEELAKRAELTDADTMTRAEAALGLAAMDAAAGKAEEAQVWLTRAKAEAGELFFSSSRTFGTWRDAMVCASEYEESLRTIAAACPGDEFEESWVIVRCIAKLIRGGRLDDAWELSDRNKVLLMRHRDRLQVVIAMERTGRREDALKYIRSVADPAFRASLAVWTVRDLRTTRSLGAGFLTFAR